MSPFRALRPLALSMFLLAGCSAGQAQPTGPVDASSDDAADAGPPCPASLPSGVCSTAAQTCYYDPEPFDPSEHENRCDCVAPEMQWTCCNINHVFSCAGGPSMFSVGSPCCPDDINPPEAPIGCGYCYPDGHEIDVICAPDDRHWRETTKSCTYVPPTCPDGGLADLDAANPCQSGDDGGGSDAAPADGGPDAAADAGASDAAGQ